MNRWRRENGHLMTGCSIKIDERQDVALFERIVLKNINQ